MIQRLKTGVNQVTGTTDSLSLRTLMNTASTGKWDAAALLNPNVFYLNTEGVVRVSLDGSTVTNAVWLELVNLGHYIFDSNIDNLKIINAQKINIQCGYKIPW